MTEDRDRRLAEEWFAKGEEDLAAAAVLSKHAATAASALFHCQQAVEKHLKGLLALRGQAPPRTHDLSLLLQICAKTDQPLERFASQCELLTTFYTAARYPGIPHVSAAASPGGAVRSAQRIVSSINRAAGRKPGGSGARGLQTR
jgi:HEPN domain-containing protein